jgi:hypothetical protein
MATRGRADARTRLIRRRKLLFDGLPNNIVGLRPLLFIERWLSAS